MGELTSQEGWGRLRAGRTNRDVSIGVENNINKEEKQEGEGNWGIQNRYVAGAAGRRRG